MILPTRGKLPALARRLYGSCFIPHEEGEDEDDAGGVTITNKNNHMLKFQSKLANPKKPVPLTMSEWKKEYDIDKLLFWQVSDQMYQKLKIKRTQNFKNEILKVIKKKNGISKL